jgi:hypothetical protein
MKWNNMPNLRFPEPAALSMNPSLAKPNPLSKLIAYVLLSGRQRLDNLEVHNCTLARILAWAIPTQCPFERNIKIFGRATNIPPLCQLNPFYEQLVGLRFRSLCCLVDQCGEKI